MSFCIPVFSLFFCASNPLSLVIILNLICSGRLRRSTRWGVRHHWHPANPQTRVLLPIPDTVRVKVRVSFRVRVRVRVRSRSGSGLGQGLGLGSNKLQPCRVTLMPICGSGMPQIRGLAASRQKVCQRWQTDLASRMRTCRLAEVVASAATMIARRFVRAIMSLWG